MTTVIGIVVVGLALIGFVSMGRSFGRATPLNKISIAWIALIAIGALYFATRG